MIARFIVSLNLNTPAGVLKPVKVCPMRDQKPPRLLEHVFNVTRFLVKDFISLILLIILNTGLILGWCFASIGFVPLVKANHHWLIALLDYQ